MKEQKDASHWHFSKKNFGYVECFVRNCKELKVEEHDLPELFNRCRTCGKPLKRTSPYSWEYGCVHAKLVVCCA